MLKFLRISDLKKCDGAAVVLDTETTGLYWFKHKCIGIGINCPDRNITGYITTWDFSVFCAAVEQIANWSSDTCVIGHNLKFDLHFLGIDPNQTHWMLLDTAVMVHLLDSRYKKSLEEAERVFLGSNSKREHVEQAPARKKIWDWPENIRAAYCINDTLVTYQLAEVLWPHLERMGLLKVLKNNMEFLRNVWRTERVGFHTDPSFLAQSKVLLEQHRDELQEQLYDAIGYTFNWRSNPQLSKALYEDLGWPRPINPFIVNGKDISRSPQTGKYNKYLTSAFILQEKAKHPLAPLVIALRESAKLGRGIQQWLSLLDQNDDAHSDFNLTGTRTGRLSSKKPNLQNVPSDIRGRMGQQYSGTQEELVRVGEYNLRRGFIARPGYVLLSIDYKQMEMRMFGVITQDPMMLKSLLAGRDVHADVAEQCWGLRDKIHREWAKSISFGLIYGMTMGSLRFRLGLEFAEAKRITDDYFRTFPSIKIFLKSVQDECKRKGYLRYWSGRIWVEEDSNKLYKGANALIQGGCADLLSEAAIRSSAWLRHQGKDYGHIISYVHDELLFEIPQGEEERAAKHLQKIMEVEDLVKIPFLNDAKIGPSYGEMYKIGGEEYNKLKVTY